MATIQLPLDFKEFLKLLNAHRVEYLLVGGYAVGYYGYPRATADLDLWIAFVKMRKNWSLSWGNSVLALPNYPQIFFCKRTKLSEWGFHL